MERCASPPSRARRRSLRARRKRLYLATDESRRIGLYSNKRRLGSRSLRPCRRLGTFSLRAACRQSRIDLLVDTQTFGSLPSADYIASLGLWLAPHLWRFWSKAASHWASSDEQRGYTHETSMVGSACRHAALPVDPDGRDQCRSGNCGDHNPRLTIRCQHGRTRPRHPAGGG
jgi:hypothetical protein